MGTLIEIKLTKKASEFPSLDFVVKYGNLFSKAEIVSREMVKEKCIFRIYVHWPENRVSEACVNELEHNRSIEKVTIIS